MAAKESAKESAEESAKESRRSLNEYRHKRRFDQTPEPAGDESAATSRPQRAALAFCVQKHLASHLHYDFRLEHGGVLLSWAVPKGPSLNPREKRLAMMTEDHPLEYGDFEGVIPDGYGAGIVMLWDRGTWQPAEPDVAAALERGQLKFTLEGAKLKGSWALVRTKGPAWGSGDPARSWLLIKHKDQWAGEVDIAAAAPLSVKTGRDFAEILAGEKADIWQEAAPAKSGATGKMFQEIIEQAAKIRAGRR